MDIHFTPAVRSCGALAAAMLACGFGAAPVRAELACGDLLSGVVEIRTQIDRDARTADSLGREREGTGIVIDGGGLVLTIGYVMVEAVSAEIITSDGRTVGAQPLGYDNETGFGLLQAASPLKVRPVRIGAAAAVKAGDSLLAVSRGGVSTGVHVVARHAFAAGFEYLLDDAIFTAPSHPDWSGAALFGRDGRLVGVGSLALGSMAGEGPGGRQDAARQDGNLFVPVDPLMAILADLIADGRPALSPPWLGLFTDEIDGRLVVARVTPGAPADRAGVNRGDVIVGVNGAPPRDLADFYRKVRAIGHAGTDVPIAVEQHGERRELVVHSLNRLDYLKLRSSI